VDGEELDATSSQLSPLLGMLVVSRVGSEVSRIDSELLSDTNAETLLSLSEEAPSATVSIPFEGLSLSDRGPDDFLGRPVCCVALTLQTTPALWQRTHGSPSCGRERGEAGCMVNTPRGPPMGNWRILFLF